MRFGYEKLGRDFGRIWPVHVEHFTELLVALRGHFGGYLVVAPRAREDLALATQASMRYLVAVGAACVESAA